MKCAENNCGQSCCAKLNTTGKNAKLTSRSNVCRQPRNHLRSLRFYVVSYHESLKYQINFPESSVNGAGSIRTGPLVQTSRTGPPSQSSVPDHTASCFHLQEIKSHTLLMTTNINMGNYDFPLSLLSLFFSRFFSLLLKMKAACGPDSDATS